MSEPAVAVISRAELTVPALIAGAGNSASIRFLEFFTVNIRNKTTRAAYSRAASAFLRWCEEPGTARLQDVQPKCCSFSLIVLKVLCDLIPAHGVGNDWTPGDEILANKTR